MNATGVLVPVVTAVLAAGLAAVATAAARAFALAVLEIVRVIHPFDHVVVAHVVVLRAEVCAHMALGIVPADDPVAAVELAVIEAAFAGATIVAVVAFAFAVLGIAPAIDRAEPVVFERAATALAQLEGL